MAVKVVTELDTFQNGRFYSKGDTLLYTGDPKKLPRWMKKVGAAAPESDPTPSDNSAAAAKKAAEEQAAKEAADKAEQERLEAEEKARQEAEEKAKAEAAKAKK